MKRLFLFLLVVILLQNNYIVYAGETQEWPPLSGKAGENITWTYHPDTGSLSFTGTGDMYNWGNGGMDLPGWSEYSLSMKRVRISEGITSIGRFAFYGCDMGQVNLPEGLLSIGHYAFANCRSLQTITLPASLTSLNSEAFSQSDSLREINVAAGSREFSSVNGVLYNKSGTELIKCPIVTGSVFEVPDGVTRIGPNAFEDCQNLKEIRFSDQLSEIALYAFWDCIGLTSVEFPESLSVIGYAAFVDCTSLASVVLPPNLTSIKEYAFANCRLTSVVLPSNLTSIGGHAFDDCADTFTVYGLPGTYAETYAAANGYSFSVIEHQYGDWVVKTAATCTSKGVEERICSICGGVDTKTIPAKGHTPVSDPAVAATCTSEGKTAGSHCSICGAVLTTQKTIPAKEHTPVSDPAVAATCTSEGKTAGSHCSVCGAVLTPQKIVAALGHKWGRFTVSKAATALELGEETRICSRCGKKETRAIIQLGAGGKLIPSSIVIYIGESIKRLAVFEITNGDAILQWTSSNQKVASVTPDGTVTGRKAGTAYITVTLKSGLTASAKVKVLKENPTKTKTAAKIKTKKIKGLKKKLVIKKGKTVRLKPKLSPKNSTDKIKYKSSNKKIATVSKKGVIKAKKAGKVKITVTAGKVKFVIKVTVKK